MGVKRPDLISVTRIIKEPVNPYEFESKATFGSEFTFYHPDFEASLGTRGEKRDKLQAKIVDKLSDDGYYSIVSPIKYKQKIVAGVKKLIDLKPQKKYEIIEKYLTKEQDDR